MSKNLQDISFHTHSICVLLFLFYWYLFAVKPHLAHYLIDVIPSKYKTSNDQKSLRHPLLYPLNFCSTIFILLRPFSIVVQLVPFSILFH